MRPALPEAPLVVAGVDELLQPGVERLHVVELEVDLEERLPVERALVDHDPVEDVAGEVIVGGEREVGEVGGDVAPAGEEEAVPRLRLHARQRHVRRRGELGRAEQPAVEVVGPAVQRADDVPHLAAPLEQEPLPVAAHVAEEVHAAVAPHQHAGVPVRFERDVVALLRHHQLVADVLRAGLEDRALLVREDLRIEIPGDRQLRRGRLQAGGGRRLAHRDCCCCCCCGLLRLLLQQPLADLLDGDDEALVRAPQHVVRAVLDQRLERHAPAVDRGDLDVDRHLRAEERRPHVLDAHPRADRILAGLEVAEQEVAAGVLDVADDPRRRVHPAVVAHEADHARLVDGDAAVGGETGRESGSHA